MSNPVNSSKPATTAPVPQVSAASSINPSSNKNRTVVLLALTALSAIATAACYFTAMPFVATASAAGIASVLAIATAVSFFTKAKPAQQPATQPAQPTAQAAQAATQPATT